MGLLQSILFATDFQPVTQDVARVAVQLASVFDTHVTLLNVLEPTLTDPAGLRKQREHATINMRELVEQLALDKVVVDESTIGVGSPVATIVRKAEEMAADLILIGTGETSRYGRPAGPTAEAILQHAFQPVLAVRPGEPAVGFHQILCPVDHSNVSRRGLQNAIRLARAFQGNVVVLSVAPGWLVGATREQEQKWRDELDRFLQGLDLDKVSWQREIRTGVPHKEIIAAARSFQADVIVMGSTGRTGMARILMGSVTRRVLQRLPCSILTVKTEDVVDELFEEDVRAINLFLAEGRELLGAGRHAEAAAKFRQVLLQNPFQVAALENLADAYTQLGRAEDAARYRRRAKALHT
jgi:nucleotide-binding universal stress UspA family protein